MSLSNWLADNMKKITMIPKQPQRLEYRQCYNGFWRRCKVKRLPYYLQNLKKAVKNHDLEDKIKLLRLLRNGVLNSQQIESYSLVTGLAYSLALSWSATMLYLFIRVQDILSWRNAKQLENWLYRVHFKSSGCNDALLFSRMAMYISTDGINSLIMNMQKAIYKVLKNKNLKEPLTESQLFDMVIQIFEEFGSIGGPRYWISYFVSEHVERIQAINMFDGDFDGIPIHSDVTVFEQLVFELCTVLASVGFTNVMEISLQKMAKKWAKETCKTISGMNSTGGICLKNLAGLNLEILFQKELTKEKMLDLLSCEETEHFFKNFLSGGDTFIFLRNIEYGKVVDGRRLLCLFLYESFVYVFCKTYIL